MSGLRILALRGFFGIALVLSCADLQGIPPQDRAPLPVGDLKVPTARTIQWHNRSKLTDKILQHWSKKPLSDWKKDGKTNVPRALMARFILKQDLEAANQYVRNVSPWGAVGSSWFNHPHGDYDFTLAALIPILFLYGDDPSVLHPDTVDHLVHVLLTEEGGVPATTVPNSWGWVRETENHLLMTEGSRYLKNRWQQLHGDAGPHFDNIANGLERWLIDLLQDLRAAGLYEFNSMPYEGYSLTALLNLEAFGSEKVRLAARKVLDLLNWNYAVGSLQLRHFPPFRRQYRYAASTKLDADYHSALIKTWMSLHPDRPKNLSVHNGGLHHAPWACWAPYRLPDMTAQWILEKPREYCVRIGHGPSSSPEIYSGGPGFLLSAGGVYRGRASLVVSRPTVLLLEDGENELEDVVHLSGPGTDFTSWNNTGVWKNVAVAAGSVHVPEQWSPAATAGPWSVYRRHDDLCVVVYSQSDAGIVHVCRCDDDKLLFKTIREANRSEARLKTGFVTSDRQRVSYDLRAPSDKWVITHVNEEPLDRRFDNWPMMTSDSLITDDSTQE